MPSRSSHSKQTSKIGLRLAVLGALLLLAAGFYFFELNLYFNLTYLKENQARFAAYYAQRPLFLLTAFFFLYVISTAFSLPGAALLTLSAGALFGFWAGTLVVSLASTLGATAAFLVARFLLQHWVFKKFTAAATAVNQQFQKEGAAYLFFLRLVPLFPFFLVNLTVGLTKLNWKTFIWVSWLGMLPATALYVNAGRQLAKVEELGSLLSPALLFSFAALGFFPLVTKKLLAYFKLRKKLSPYPKPKKFDYNMLVIGAGSAGLVTAYLSAAAKAKVALVEEKKMGGDCLNTGCVPSKALLRAAKAHHQLAKAAALKQFGIDQVRYRSNFKQTMRYVANVIKQIEPNDSPARYSKLGVECLSGRAELLSPYAVKVGDKTYTAKNITIATGASPFVPLTLQTITVASHQKKTITRPFAPLTSDSLWQLKSLPKRFLIIGGGPIGCELAQAFTRLGAEVTLVEQSERLLPAEAPAVSALLENLFSQEGIRIKTSHTALQFQSVVNRKTGKKQKQLLALSEGRKIAFPFDQVLVALGRRPNTQGFGLEKLRIALRRNGTIEVNDRLQATYPNLFACGDVTGPYQFTHAAGHQAWFAAFNGLFRHLKSFKVDYRIIPWAVYTDPEVATVGLTETNAKKNNLPHVITHFPMRELDRAVAEAHPEGFVRVLTAPGTDKILGATIVGHYASTLIVEFIIALKYRLGMNKLLATIRPYPSWSEANKYAAARWKQAHLPKRALRFATRFHRFMRGG